MSSAMKLLAALFLLVPSLCAQTPVHSDAPVRTITLTLNAGTLDSIHVLTQGSEKFDFATAPGGSCTAGQSYLAGQTCTVNLAFHPFYPGERRGAVVLLPRSGPPLAQQFVSAQAVGSVNTFVPGTMSTVAGNTAWIYGGDGQPATQTSIFLPFGLAVDAAGNMYIADCSNNRIRKVDAATGLVSTIAGTGNIGATGDNGPATAATLAGPSSVVLDAAGNLYVADAGNNAVRRVDAVTGIITTVAGTLGRHGYTGDRGPANSATLNTPNGIALDSSNNLYLADTGNHAIRRVDAVTGKITTVAGTGTAGYNGDSLPATSAQLSSPWSVTVAPTGELYIADQNNHRVRLVSPAGMISTVAGSGIAGFSGEKGPATEAQLNEPASVVLDVAGNLYIADSGNNRVRKISAKDSSILTIAGIDSEGFSGDNGPANQAGLYGPYTLALDGADNLFVADVFHNRIRKILVNSASMKFPAIRVGRVSAPLTQTVENDGNAPLNFSSIAAVSNAQVDPATVCSTTVALAPSDTCDTAVDFAPKVTGDPVLGSVALNSDAGNGPGIIVPWGTVLSIDPTTLILSASANPGLTGQTITFEIQAISAGTTPTGSIVVTDVFGQTTTTLGTAPLVNGIAYLPVSGLLTGAHAITATYSGDDSNAPATSGNFIETIKDAQAPTLTSLVTSASPIDAGATLTLTATVATKTQGAGSYAIAGTITFLDGSTTMGTATLDPATASLDRATASFTVSTLSVGSHSLTAVYAGTANDTPSTSPAVTQKVKLATTTLALATSSTPLPSGAPLTLTASANSTGGIPSGSIAFYVGSTQLGSGSLNAQGIAVLQLPSALWLPASYVLTAAYAGDASDSPATSQPVAEVINLASTNVLLSSSLNPAGMGAQVLFTATAASNGGTPTGNVTFSDGPVVLGSATLNAAGIAAWSTSTLPIGSHPITAAYAGDPYDSNATSAPLQEQVQVATIAILLNSSKAPSLFADSVTMTAAVTGSGAAPTGSVDFFDGATRMGTVALDPSGNAAMTTSAMTIGDHAVTARYSGDSNHAQVTSAPVDQQVLQATALALQTSATQVIAGLPVTMHVNLSGTSNQPGAPQPGGSIVLVEGSTTLATLTPDAAGAATYTANLAAGRHTLSATYAGDRNDAPSNAAAVAIQVDLATTTTTLTATPSPAAFGAPVTLTANVSGNGGTATGAVAFMDGATALSTGTLSNGTATLTLTTLAPGIHALTAAYAGDANDQPSQSPAVQEQVALHTTLGLTANANPALLGDAVTLTLTAANGSATPPTGSINLTDNGTPLAPVQLVNGSASVTLQAPALGSHTLLAAYIGDANNGPATAQPLVVNVTLRPSKTSLTASSSALGAGQQLILISVVQATGSQPPTGNVTFQSASTNLGVVAIGPSGVATLTLTPPAGALVITAQYSGDALYAPSTSVAVAVAVGPPDAFTLTAKPPSLSLPSGSHGQVTVSVVSNPNFHDTLAFGCAGLPEFATCNFSTDRMAVNSGFPQSLTVTVDTGNPLGAGTAAALPFGALLALLLGRRRRWVRGLVTAALLASVALCSTGCATQFAQSTTPAGDYSFQIVGTGVTTGTTQTATIHLAVTK